jgi:hypothetical protein
MIAPSASEMKCAFGIFTVSLNERELLLFIWNTEFQTNKIRWNAIFFSEELKKDLFSVFISACVNKLLVENGNKI